MKTNNFTHYKSYTIGAKRTYESSYTIGAKRTCESRQVVTITCGWCNHTLDTVYTLSLAGSGKRCPSCGGVHRRQMPDINPTTREFEDDFELTVHLAPGTQVLYIPNHAGRNYNHPGVEKGFVTSVTIHYGGGATVFCRYMVTSAPELLRTMANSEGADISNIMIYPHSEPAEILRLAELGGVDTSGWANNMAT